MQHQHSANLKDEPEISPSISSTETKAEIKMRVEQEKLGRFSSEKQECVDANRTTRAPSRRATPDLDDDVMPPTLPSRTHQHSSLFAKKPEYNKEDGVEKQDMSKASLSGAIQRPGSTDSMPPQQSQSQNNPSSWLSGKSPEANWKDSRNNETVPITSLAEVSDTPVPGAVPVSGINQAGSVAAAAAARRASPTRSLGENERSGVVVAAIVTQEELADEVRDQVRSEIHQELRAQMPTAKAVPADKHCWSSWSRKQKLIAVCLLLLAIIAIVVGVVLGTGNDSGGSTEENVFSIARLHSSRVDDMFGKYVVFSRDGSTMAVGGPGKSYVRTFQNINNSWNVIGEIQGSGGFGSRLELSKNGTVMVVGAPGTSDVAENAGQARAFLFDGSNRWNQIGQNLNGYNESDFYGWDVATSDDGHIVAVSARKGDPSSEKVNAGYTRVFGLNSSLLWEQIGSDLNGENRSDQFGRSLDMNGDGRRAAVGAVRGNGGTGRITAFDFVQGEWNRTGQPLDGDNVEDWQGTSLSLTGDGSVLAIAADGTDTNGNNAGMVRVYQLVGCCDWVQRGQNILGESQNDQFGAGHISLSDDGQLLAVGALHNSNNTGKAYLFEYNDNDEWELLAEVFGENKGDKFGFSVNLSGDGSLFAVGAPTAAIGYVRVYSVKRKYS